MNEAQSARGVVIVCLGQAKERGNVQRNERRCPDLCVARIALQYEIRSQERALCAVRDIGVSGQKSLRDR